MPTQEERLQTVEFDLRQFKTETIKAYGDMAFEMTIIKGLTENAIGRLATLSDTTEKHFERVDIRLDGMNAHLESMDKRLERVETHRQQLEPKFDDQPTLLTQLLARLPKTPQSHPP